MIEKLDDNIRSELIYSQTPEGKPTLIYVPGLGTMGKSNRRLKNFRERLEKQGHDINIATFTYKSHSKDTVTGFENDSEDLEKIVEKVRQRGASKIGLFTVCYGSYVSLEYLKKNDADAIIMLEPYIGIDSLKGPLKSLAKSAKKMWLPKIPMGFRYE
jgi:dienelactone hydrolase